MLSRNRLAALALAIGLVRLPPLRAAEGPVLTYAISADILGLDPDAAADAASLLAVRHMYEGLIDFDGSATDRFVPRLSTIVPTRENGFLSSDGKTYVFPLRRDIRFHDGSPLTATDVKYSLLRFLLTAGNDAPSGLLLEPLTGRRVAAGADGGPDRAVFDLADAAVSIEGGALVLRLPRPFTPLLSVLAAWPKIISKNYVVTRGGWDGTKQSWARFWNAARDKTSLYERENGTGPFKLLRWDRQSRALTMTRHGSYWRAPASLAAVQVLTVEDLKTRRQMFERGDADVAQLDADLPLLRDDAVIFFNQKIEARDNPWIGSGALDGQGLPADFFADSGVRRGFAAAFDADAFIRDGFRGAATRAPGPFPGAILPSRPASDRRQPFSLAAAQRELRAAHGGKIWADGFQIPIVYPEGDARTRSACMTLKNGLEQVNPKFLIACRALARTRLLAELDARKLPAFVDNWILDYPDPHDVALSLFGSQGRWGEALGVSNSRVDALIASGAAESDPVRRAALYHELEAWADAEAPMIFTVETAGVISRRPGVQNLTQNFFLPYGNLYEATKLK